MVQTMGNFLGTVHLEASGSKLHGVDAPLLYFFYYIQE